MAPDHAHAFGFAENKNTLEREVYLLKDSGFVFVCKVGEHANGAELFSSVRNVIDAMAVAHEPANEQP